MSPSTKRNAHDAFEGDNKDSSVKKKRPRRSGGSKAQRNVDKPSTEKDVVSGAALPKNEVSQEPKTVKLEDRITAPASSTELATIAEPNKVMSKKTTKKHSGSKHMSTKTQLAGSTKWSLSPASGGIFIDHDPIITTDGQHLILPTKEHVNIYSTKTSLLVRSIPIGHNDTISCCSIAASEENSIFTLTKRGVLLKHEWTTGSKLGRWKVGASIRSITPVASETPTEDVVAIRFGEGRSELILLSLLSGEKFEKKSLLQSSRLQSVVASSNANTIVTCSEQSVHVGTSSGTEYKWYELPIAGSINSFDARITQQSNKKMPAVDIVVGLANGAIMLYEDILSRLTRNSKSGQNVDLSGRKFHWHRTQAKSVKWSKDGNYIISGGDETVLVIWQLETNQQQFLPHLSTAILNITISSTGAQYAIRLADNSVMILSTADLIPSTNVAGLSLSSDRNDRFPMQLHPAHSNRLLAAVPVRPTGKDSRAATHLQTFDIDTNLQLNRQALTRNITTAVNVSPEGLPLEEPDVVHLEISFDGDWLATVDRWSPNSSDLQALHLNEEQLAKHKHTETVLRFWQWNADENNWELVTRIDEPHPASRYSILSLASNPATIEFTTMGEDGTLKFWQPRRRIRDGVQVRKQSGLPLFTWACARTVQVEKHVESTLPTGALTYSGDGSVLAASWSHKKRHIHLIDTQTGALCMSLPHLLYEGPANIAMMGRFMLCLSSSLRVFDMITLQTTFTMDIDRNHSSFLVVGRNNAFAIAVNPMERNVPAHVSIFDIEDPDQGSISDFEIPSQMRALLADAGGFVVVDNDCKITKIARPGGVASIKSDSAGDSVSKSLEDVFGRDKFVETRSQKLIDNVDNSRNLADIFSVSSTSAQMAVSEVFDQVSRAISAFQVQVGA